MQPEQFATRDSRSTSRAVRHHLAVVVTFLALGAAAGWLYGASAPVTYTSTAHVLVNPSVGNPFAPTPSSVRQDQQTSLETEAQVARSTEVLGQVAALNASLTTAELERAVRVSVPANTQVLEISFTAADAATAQQGANAVAEAYLVNRAERFDEVTAARVDRVETQTLRVIDDLRAATAAAQLGSPAKRSFNAQLADALRNELVSLRAQRTALENSESPAGSVIAPAAAAVRTGALVTIAAPIGGALVGLAFGCLVAVLLERLMGVVRSASDVVATGLPVAAVVPRRGRLARLLRRHGTEDFDATIRRLRAHVLDSVPRPDVISVAPAGDGRSDGLVSEAVAESFAKAGHRVVLVRTEVPPPDGSLAVASDGLAEAVLHERLSVLALLQPSVEPLLSLLPSGRITAETRELFGADRLRAVLDPLIEAGHLVVIQAPGLGTVEGEAVVGAADLGLVVVRLGRTRPRELDPLASHVWRRGTTLAAVVVGPRSRLRSWRSTSRFEAARNVDGDLVSHDLVKDPMHEHQPADLNRPW